jgi:hypothetical protein
VITVLRVLFVPIVIAWYVHTWLQLLVAMPANSTRLERVVIGPTLLVLLFTVLAVCGWFEAQPGW